MKMYLFDSDEFSSMSLAELIDLADEFSVDVEELRVEDEEEWRKAIAEQVEIAFDLIYGTEEYDDTIFDDILEADEW